MHKRTISSKIQIRNPSASRTNYEMYFFNANELGQVIKKIVGSNQIQEMDSAHHIKVWSDVGFSL